MTDAYDAFVSFCSDDREVVRGAVDHLRRHQGLALWLDEHEIDPGDGFMDRIRDGLARTRLVLVFLGHRLGPHQEEEILLALERRERDRAFRVVPIVLPGVDPRTVRVPAVLRATSMDVFERLADLDLLCRRLGVGRVAAVGTGEDAAPSEVGTVPVDDTARHLASLVHADGNLAFFVGSNPLAGAEAEALPPRAYRLSRTLLDQVGLGGLTGDYVPPLPLTADFASSGDQRGALLDALERYVYRARAEPPEAFRSLARVLRRLRDRRGGRHTPLVVTSGLDLTLEKALASEGLSFRRLIPLWDAPAGRDDLPPRPAMVITDHPAAPPGRSWDELEELVSSAAPRIRPDRREEVRDLDLLGDATVDVLLLKQCGTIELAETPVLTSLDHELALARWGGRMPRELLTRLEEACLVLLGYAPLDADWRLLDQTLLQHLRGSPQQVLVRPAPSAEEQPVERRLWLRLERDARRRGTWITTDATRFLASLEQALALQPDDRRRPSSSPVRRSVYG